MNSNDILDIANKVKVDLINFDEEYDVEKLKMLRSKYCRLKRKENLSKVTSKELNNLRYANKLYDKYIRMKRSYKSVVEQHQSVLFGCQNCKRRENYEDISPEAPYDLRFRFHSPMNLIKGDFLVCTY